MSCKGGCLKVCMIAFNVVGFIMGGILIWIAAHLFTSINSQHDHFVDHTLKSVSIVCMVVGGLTLFITCLGIWSTIAERASPTLIYLILLLALTITEIVVGAYVLAKKDDLAKFRHELQSKSTTLGAICLSFGIINICGIILGIILFQKFDKKGLFHVSLSTKLAVCCFVCRKNFK